MKSFVRIALAGFSLLGCSTEQPLSPSTGVEVPIVRFRSEGYSYSSFSGAKKSTRVVVRDAIAWQSVWNTLHQGISVVPALPIIDFSKESVVFAALGERGSGGYGVVFKGASENQAGGLNVVVMSVLPGGGCGYPTVMTQPVDIARIPARYSLVQFVEEDEEVKCD